MKEKIKWGKFILDCFICFGMMMFSIVVLIKPLSYLYAFFIENGIKLFGFSSYNDFYFMALEFNILSLIPFAIIYFVYKVDNTVSYKIYTSSFVICFVFLTSFWWFVAMNFCTGPIK